MQNYIMLLQTAFKTIYKQNKILQMVGEQIA